MVLLSENSLGSWRHFESYLSTRSIVPDYRVQRHRLVISAIHFYLHSANARCVHKQHVEHLFDQPLAIDHPKTSANPKIKTESKSKICENLHFMSNQYHLCHRIVNTGTTLPTPSQVHQIFIILKR